MEMIATIAAAAEMIMMKRHSLYPVAAIVWGTSAFGARIATLILWITYEVGRGDQFDSCPYFAYAIIKQDAVLFNTPVAPSVWYARVLFATLMMVLACVYVRFASTAVHKNWM